MFGCRVHILQLFQFIKFCRFDHKVKFKKYISGVSVMEVQVDEVGLRQLQTQADSLLLCPGIPTDSTNLKSLATDKWFTEITYPGWYHLVVFDHLLYNV